MSATQLVYDPVAPCLTTSRAVPPTLQTLTGKVVGFIDNSKPNFDVLVQEPLHVERGFDRNASTVTVVGALGTWSMNMTAAGAEEVLAMLADTMQYPASSDYVYGGAPFVLLSPQHANVFHAAGWGKAEVKRRLREASKLRAGRARGNELARMATGRRDELGELGPDTMVPIAASPQDIGIGVAGGPGSHSVFVPVSAHTRSVTRAIELSE